MKIQIRRADLADLDQLVTWRMEVLKEVFPPSYCEFPEGLEEENRRYYQQALANDSHIACFAEMDGEPIGCGGLCLHTELPSPDNPGGQCAYLMNIYCRPAFRGQGVGRAVVRWLIDRAKECGAQRIYLETSEVGRPLYEGVGFVDFRDLMMLPLHPE